MFESGFNSKAYSIGSFNGISELAHGLQARACQALIKAAVGCLIENDARGRSGGLAGLSAWTSIDDVSHRRLIRKKPALISNRVQT
jgi:hypothetical protein